MRNYPLYPVSRLNDLKELTDMAASVYASRDAFQMMTETAQIESVSYQRFGEEICALANAMIEKGLSGSTIALVGENTYAWVLVYLSVVNINATIVPLDKELSKEGMLDLVVRADAGILFYSNTFEEEATYIKQNISGMEAVSFRGGCGDDSLDDWVGFGKALVAQGIDKYSGIEIDRKRTCTILFTSGTTGQSKGVMLSHACLAANIVSACELILYTPEDIMLSVLPIHHTYEAMAGILCPIMRGSTVAFCESVKTLQTCFELFRPTVMVLVPLYVETFCKRIWESAKKNGKVSRLKFGIAICNFFAAIGIDIRGFLLREVRQFFGGRLKFVISGGAHLNPALVKSFKDFGITLVQGYGTTECSPIIAENRNKYHKASSVGLPLSCCEVRIDNSGQILVRGSNVMKGYLNDEEGTTLTFNGEWYKTGDIGYIDNDGFLYVTGRCKNLIVLKNGKNVMPEEIEQLLLEIPLISEAVVKEAPGGEFVMALIYPDPDAAKSMDDVALLQTIDEEIDKINQRLVQYKKIRRFELRKTEFPKTTKKTIIRHLVKDEEGK